MSARRKTFALLLLTLCLLEKDGNASNWALRGYVLEMPLLWELSPPIATHQEWRLDSQTLARQNLRWYPSQQITVAVEVDERLLIGESARLTQAAAHTYRFEEPYFDWQRSFVEQEKIVLAGKIDRLWITGYHGNLQATLGRQRIAWGTALVWNPIDLFNPTSPLDFANVEKPGVDGLRLQYYFSPASRLEIAGALQDPEENSIAAAQLVLNGWEYDWHFLGGRRGREWVAGFAWAGDIRGGGFRGELLERFPSGGDGLPDHPDLTSVLSADYAFKSSLYLHGEALYGSRGSSGDAGGLNLMRALQDNRLTPARWSLFAEVGRQLNPLIYANLSGILNPIDHSWYAGPTVTWNAVTNIDVTLTGLIFGGNSGTEFGDNGTTLLAQAQWSW